MVTLLRYQKTSVYIFIGLLIIFLVLLTRVIPFGPQIQTLWKYQCIDTMKVSRDNAHFLMNDPNTPRIIDAQLTEVTNLGANCVAIDTPYDEEFVPYLTQWTKSARKKNLHVWFRGNWSSWEGWFGYPKGVSTDEHIHRTQQFIHKHSDLFRDGDIFSAIPEPENGWPNGYISQNEFSTFRKFLVDENYQVQQAFSSLGKKVETNWFSLSGGVAKSVLDKKTVNALGNIVTIDHYVQAPEEMSSYIDYFKNTLHARVVIGEFGAPIADINGEMNEKEQAEFVDAVFWEIYKHNKDVLAINYWTLTDGSTALLNSDGTPKKVTQVIKMYYKPAIITGTVVNTWHFPLHNIIIKTIDGAQSVTTDFFGNFTIVVPAKNTTIVAEGNGFKTKTLPIPINKDGEIHQTIILTNNK